VRYSIYSGDPNGYFSIDALSGTIRTSSGLDHETHPSVLLNVQAMSGDPPAYGHSQVRHMVDISATFSKTLKANFAINLYPEISKQKTEVFVYIQQNCKVVVEMSI
jgi:hypothetical protein